MDYRTALEHLRLKKTGWDTAGFSNADWAAWDYLSDLPTEDWERAPKGAADGVVIIGKAGGHKVAPWMEPGWEFWGMNEQHRGDVGNPHLSLYDRWFQLHPPHYLQRHYPKGLRDLEVWWTRKWGIPCYLDCVYPAFPDSVAYPLDEVEALTPFGWYHASSMDWMMALAILEGFKRIILAGISISTYPITDGEPLSSRAALEYWVGVAHGRGISVEIAGPFGHLFKILHMAVHESKLQYGFEREPGHDLAESSEWDDYR